MPDPDGQVTASAYASLAEAVAAVPTNGTVIVDQNVALAEPIVLDGKNVTFNLMGNTITAETAFKVTSGKLEVLNGTIDAAVDGIYAVASGDKTIEITVGEDVVINAVDCAVIAKGKAVINVNGTLNSTGSKYAALQGNGNASSAGTVFNVNKTAVITSADIGIYFPQEGVLNINGGSVTGTTAVYVKGSEFNMTAGTLTANGAKAEFVHGNNGAASTGDALVVENSDYPSGTPVVSITGGKMTSANGKAVASYAQEGYEVVTGFVKGGSFSSNIAEDGLVAEGYKATKSGKLYKVTAA